MGYLFGNSERANWHFNLKIISLHPAISKVICPPRLETYRVTFNKATFVQEHRSVATGSAKGSRLKSPATIWQTREVQPLVFWARHNICHEGKTEERFPFGKVTKAGKKKHNNALPLSPF